MRLPGSDFNLLQRCLGMLALLCMVATAPTATLAQMVPSTETVTETVEIPENLTAEQIRDLVARLPDDQVRELMISQLDKMAIAQGDAPAPATLISNMRDGFEITRNTILHAAELKEEIFNLPQSVWQQMTNHGQTSGGFILFQLTGLLLVGWAARLTARRLLLKASASPLNVLPLGKRFDLACYGFFMGIIELAAFAAGAFLFIKMTGQETPMAQAFWYQIIWCLVIIKLVLTAVRQVISATKPDTCLVPVTANVSRQVVSWTLILTSFLLLPKPLLNMIRDFGASPELDLLLSTFFSGGFVALLIALAYHLRHHGEKLIADEECGSIRLALARNWWLLATAYLLMLWFMAIGKRAATGEGSLGPGLTSIFLFVMIPYFDMGLKWLITRYFEAQDESDAASTASTVDDMENLAESTAEENDSTSSANDIAESADNDVIDDDKQPDKRAPVYIATALRYARVLMVVLILGIFLRLWDIDARAIIAHLLGQRVSGALFDISITVLLTWALWGVIRISIERKLDTGSPRGEEDGETEAGGLGGTRVETVLPLIKVFLKITLIVMAVLISLSALGVNIGPLIAGAGVVGIAIGFGAQTLVRDIVSGFFYLIDDAFRIGEYVVIDQIRGTVEKISIRSFQLRHHNGPVHTIPYGEITTLTNWSRDWAIMKFELRIAFETDIDQVRKIIKQIGIDMFEDPQFGPLMLAPMKSQGVNRMDDSALIIRCKFTAVPGQQYLIRREAFTRIQKVFEEKGIHFAPRRVLVEASTPAEAANAAAAVIDQEGEGKKQPKGSDL